MKDLVLAILLQHKGEYLSGQSIADQLEVSRTAVWKAVEVLREQGYPIRAITHEGYCLDADADVISAVQIAAELHTKRLGRKIETHRILESTNIRAKEAAQEGAQEGLLVIAEEQSGGKGRKGRSFYSPPYRGIYMSLVLRPDMPAEDSSLITVCASVAVARAVQNVAGVETGIKWVNDVYVGDRKICGILTEASIEMESLRTEYAVLGIGINVSTLDGEFPLELRTIAGSLSHAGPVQRCQLIAEFLNQFEAEYDDLGGKNFLSEYKARSIVLGKTVEVLQSQGSWMGKAMEIDDQARLVVEDQTGNRHVLNSGEVSLKLKK